MFLKKVKIRNLFQHKDITLEFSDGINLILGPNGIGKTNILNAIYYALVGELPFNKEQCINKNSEGPSYVEIDFQANNHCVFVHRDVNGISYCVIDGRKAIGSKTVTELVLAVLSVPKEFVEHCIFLKQGQLREFINATAKRRMEILDDILGITVYSLLNQKLREYINQKKGELKNDFSCEVNQYQSIALEYQSLPEVRNEKELLELSKARSQLANLEKVFQDRKATYIDVLQQIDILDQKIKLIEEKIKLFDISDITPENIIRIEEQIKEYNNLLSKLNDLLREWRTRPEPSAFSEDDILEIEKRIASNNGIIKLLKSYLDTVSSNRCPICKSPVDPEELFKQIRGEIHSLTLNNDQLIKQKDLIKNELQKNKRRTAIRQMIAKVKEFRDHYFEKYKDSKIDITKIKDNFAAIKNNLLNVRSLKDQKETLLIKKTTISEQLSALEKELEKLSFCRNESDDILNREMDILKKKEQLKTKLKLLEEYLGKHEQVKVKRERLEIIEQVSDVFSYRGVQSKIIENFLSRFLSSLNQILSQFDCNYRIKLTEDVSFEAIYKDGHTIPDKQLSYGEQLALAIAVMLAFALTSKLNLLVLDEPTLGLDDDRVKRLSEVLERFANKRIQLIIATHEPCLQSCAKKVFRLERFTS